MLNFFAVRIKETIKNLMTPSYKTAAAQSGQGMDVRQKQVIRTQATWLVPLTAVDGSEIRLTTWLV